MKGNLQLCWRLQATEGSQVGGAECNCTRLKGAVLSLSLPNASHCRYRLARSPQNLPLLPWPVVNNGHCAKGETGKNLACIQHCAARRNGLTKEEKIH